MISLQMDFSQQINIFYVMSKCINPKMKSGTTHCSCVPPQRYRTHTTLLPQVCARDTN